MECEQIIAFVSDGIEGEQAWCLGNLCKYLYRLGEKTPDPIPDLVKARDYANMLCKGKWYK